MPELKRAELIGGVVYIPSPLSLDHGDMDISVCSWVNHYAAFTPGCRSSSNATCLMLEDSPQPDVHLRILPEFGGRTEVEENLASGAPEFVAEVCFSSAAYDLHQKLALYQEAGVDEYLAVVLHEGELRWHRLQGGEYQIMSPSEDGVYRSVVFPGLWLNGIALLANNMQQVLATLQQGLETEEHTAFCTELEQRQADA